MAKRDPLGPPEARSSRPVPFVPLVESGTGLRDMVVGGFRVRVSVIVILFTLPEFCPVVV